MPLAAFGWRHGNPAGDRPRSADDSGAVQSTGKIVVAQPTGAGGYELVRYNTNGSLDGDFLRTATGVLPAFGLSASEAPAAGRGGPGG